MACRYQAIIWTNAGILLIGPLRTNFSEIFIQVPKIFIKKIYLKCRLENGTISQMTLSNAFY